MVGMGLRAVDEDSRGKGTMDLSGLAFRKEVGN